MTTSYLIGVIQLADKRDLSNIYALGILSLLSPRVFTVTGVGSEAIFYGAKRGAACLRNAPRPVQLSLLIATLSSGMVLTGRSDIRSRFK